MYNLVNLQFDEDNWEKIQNDVEKIKVDFWPSLYEICGCLGNVKNDRHAIDIL